MRGGTEIPATSDDRHPPLCIGPGSLRRLSVKTSRKEEEDYFFQGFSMYMVPASCLLRAPE